jgi:hypothetical protein
VGATGWGENPGDLGDGLSAWAVRGFLWRVLAMTSWSGTCASPRWVVAELLEVEPGVLLEQDAGAMTEA